MLARTLICVALFLPAFAITPHAAAINTFSYSMVVPCDTGALQSSGPLVEMPSGILFVTVAGACNYSVSTASDWNAGPVDTPCSIGPVQNVPCVSGYYQPYPRALCTWSFSAAGTGCGYGLSAPGTSTLYCGEIYVEVNFVCVTGANFHMIHAGGPVYARFVDNGYYNNAGSLVVTFQWTPV
jgi:hypothetical protein